MKFGVIGLGRFGFEVAVNLAENGMEVLAVDSLESQVNAIKDRVTHAIVLKVNDEEALRNIGIQEMDTVIVAMGENFAQSILITAILKQRLKVERVITRSISQIHKDILELIGADLVILPEQEVGRKLADTLSLPFSALIRISSNFSISQLQAPENFIGNTVSDLDLFNVYNVRCIGRKVEDEIIPMYDDYVIQDGDLLVLAGYNKSILRISKI